MIDVIGHVGSEAPIVAAILEQIAQWHRIVREAMHKDRLQQTLHIVNRIATGGNAKKDTKQNEKIIISDLMIMQPQPGKSEAV